jgi:3D (Asp-Asp-Asp) domain-containing protein
MKLHHFLITGLFLSSAVFLQASVDSVLTLELKRYTQSISSTSSTTEKGRVSNSRVDSKQLLKLIAKARSTQFPDGSKLQVAVDGTVYVADSKGRWVTDVSEYLRVDFDDKNRLFDGHRNLMTGTETTKNFFPIRLVINLPSMKGSVSGIANEDFKAGEPNSDGVRILSGASKSMVSGKGSAEGGTALYQGTLRLVGRRAEIVR